MVSAVYITKYKKFTPPSRFNTIENFGKPGDNNDKFEYSFDLYTLNFNDLNYWNAETDLHKKTLHGVINTLYEKILIMQKENIISKTFEPTYEDDDTFILPEWWFGTKPEKLQNSKLWIQTKLPEEERKSILLFHLNRLYNDLLYIEQKLLLRSNKPYYCYLD